MEANHSGGKRNLVNESIVDNFLLSSKWSTLIDLSETVSVLIRRKLSENYQEMAAY
jgi:hypothetical protein